MRGVVIIAKYSDLKEAGSLLLPILFLEGTQNFKIQTVLPMKTHAFIGVAETGMTVCLGYNCVSSHFLS